MLFCCTALSNFMVNSWRPRTDVHSTPSLDAKFINTRGTDVAKYMMVTKTLIACAQTPKNKQTSHFKQPEFLPISMQASCDTPNENVERALTLKRPSTSDAFISFKMT